MFQRSLTRAAFNVSRTRVASVVSRTALSHPIRFNSTKSTETPETPEITETKPPKTPEELERRAWHDRQDALQRDWDAKILRYDEFLPRTQNPSTEAYIIDVREPDEVIQGMIPSAVNIPLSVLGDALNMDRNIFAGKFGFPKPRSRQEVVFYCRSGKRSASACDVAKRNGYVNIYNYQGSWLEWVEKQNPAPSEEPGKTSS